MVITQQQCSELKGIEDKLFAFRVKHDITIVLLWEYIEEWLKGALEAIISPSRSSRFKKLLRQLGLLCEVLI